MTGSKSNWRLTTLGEIAAKLVDGSHNPPPRMPTGLPMLSARNIEDNRIVWRDFRLIAAEAFHQEHQRTRITPGDVLLTIVGSIGRSAVVPPTSPQFALQRSVAVIAIPEVDPQFISFQVQTPSFQAHLSAMAKGTAQKGVYLGDLSASPVELAPLPEQHRIVEAIESYLTRLDDAVATLERVQQNLKRYRASVLKAAVEGRLVPSEAERARQEGRDYEPASVLLERILEERRRRWIEDAAEKARAKAEEKTRKAGKPWTPKDDTKTLEQERLKAAKKYKEPEPPDTSDLPDLPEGWCWATVAQLASGEPHSLTDGPFGSNLKTEHYTAQGPRVVRLQNIGDGVFFDERAHISREHYKHLLKHAVQAGDILIRSLGEEIPTACLVPNWLGPAIVKADCLRFAPNPSVALAGYLMNALNSPPTRTRTESLIHGVGRPRVGLSLLRNLALPLPPLAEQRRVLEDIERRLSVAAQVLATHDAQTGRLGRLRQSILKWAFEGRLVPQDPNDEPASVLLERIQAERERMGAKKKRNSRVGRPKGTP